jgi:glycosyltransferase involved in cell wall biosynthesis
MRLLFLTPFVPNPHASHAVASTVFQWLRRLAERHQVDLLSFVESSEDRSRQTEIARVCRSVTLIHRRTSRPALALRMLRHPARPRMHWAFHDERMARAVRERTSRHRYDLVQVEYSQMAQYRSLISPTTPRVLVKHDVRAVMAWRALKTARGPNRALAFFEWLMIPHYELTTCQQFDAVVTLSEHNRRLLQGFLPGLPVSVIPPGIDTAEEEPTRYERSGREVAFFGNMASWRNVGAVLFFYREVFPLVQSAVPGARLHIIGAKPSGEIEALARDNAVIVTGYVDDVRAYFSGCDVAIAPMQVGGGILMKVLEMMAVGLPVVATPVANEGVDADPDSEILLANDAKGFARQVVRLLHAGELRRRVGLGGQRFVGRRFDWTACIDGWEALYKDILMRRNELLRP